MTNLTDLPLLDPTPIAELWEASPMRAARLLGFYLEDLPSQMETLLQAMQELHTAEVGAIAHSLKSASRQMGALKIGEAAYLVEQAARAMPTDPYLPQFVNSLQSLMAPTVDAVREQIKTTTHS